MFDRCIGALGSASCALRLTAPVAIVVVLRHVDAVFEGGVEGAFKVLTGCVERWLNVFCGVEVVHAI